MPDVSRFFGIIIYMYHNDHLPPHFHAEYGEHEAIYAIETLELLRGRLPRRANAMVIEWAAVHRAQLRENWQLARQGLPLRDIDALD
ncbi:MAG: DUF4160 domain-containing protein [Caldilineaceae bacterium]